MISITRHTVRFLLVALFFISLFVSIPFAHGQEDEYDLSTVNIYNSEYTRTGSLFEIDFEITNEVLVQPGVRYGVLLRQHTDEGQVTVDEYAEAEVITLGPKEELTRHITYAAPKVLDGLFTLYVVAKNSDGFTLATHKVADVALNREEAIGVHIDVTSCYLTQVGDTSGTRYTITDTARVPSGAILTSHCTVENVSGAMLEISPRVTTYRRSVFGETVTAPLAEEDSLVLNAGETREVITTLPPAGDPQTYVLALAYGYVSNSVMYRYTVEGGSASLQNIRLDKDEYVAGESAQVSLDWIGSVELSGPQALISFTTGSGTSCGDPNLHPLIGSMHHEITVPITENCSEPDVSVRLSDSGAGILGEYIYAIDKTPGASEQETLEVEEQGIFKNTALLILLGCAVVVFGALMIAFFSRRKKEDPMVPPTIGPIVFFLALGLLSSFHAGSAEAMSVNVNAPQPIPTRFVEFHVSLDRSEYTPGEMINVTASVELISEENCGDMGAPAGCNMDKSVGLTVGGTEIFDGPLGGGSLTGSATLQAASSPGTHTLNVTARNQGVVKNRTIEYTVTASSGQPPGAPPDTGGSSNGGSSNGAYSIKATDISCNENDSFHRSKAKITWTTDASGGVLYNGAGFAGAHAPGGFSWTTAQVNNVDVGWLAPNSVHTFTLIVNGETKAEVEVEAGSCGGGGQNPGPGPGTNPPGSGTGTFSITAEPCIIPLGGSTCSIPGTGGAGITITGAPSSAAIFVRSNTGNAAPNLYGFNTGSVSADWVRPHLVFDVYEGASRQSGTWTPTGTRLGSVADVAQCASGSVWNADAIRCVASPPAQGGQYIEVCTQVPPVADTPAGDPNCPSVSGDNYDGVSFGWNYAANYVKAEVLHGRTLSFEVSGLQPGAKMCKVFLVHPDGWQIPSPIAYAHQFCTYEANYSDISVSNGTAYIEIPNVNPEYKVDAQYLMFFKNPGSDKAVRMSAAVTPFGNGNADVPQTTNYCSPRGSDMIIYLGGYGLRTLDTPIPITMNIYPTLSDARANWTVSAVEFNAAPGDSVTFSRTSGQFDGDGSTGNPNNQFTMTVSGTPRTVGVHVAATTDQVVCGSSTFSAFDTENIHYAGVGQSYACTGAIPEHGRPWNGGESTTNVPNKPWTFVPWNTPARCEFKCDAGYMWDDESACVVNTAGAGGSDAWKWRVTTTPSPDFIPPPGCSANMSGIQNNDSCTPAEEGTCDSSGMRYTCRDITGEYPYFLVGKVVDMEGEPVPNLKIAAGYTGPSPHSDYRVYGTTGSDGRYKMRIDGNALRGYLRLPSGAPFDEEEPTPGYTYWNGGQIRRDQTTIEGAEKLVPATDAIVRQIQTATAANGKSVIIADTPDLMSLELLVPATGIKGSTLSIAAQVLNNTTTAAPAGFENTFSYRWGTNTTWNDLTPISKNALPSGETSADELSFQLPAAGELWIKHCVNTNSAFSELTTNNNCVEAGQPVVIADPASGLEWKKVVDLMEDEYTGALPTRCIDAPVVDTACSVAMPSPCHMGDFIYQCE